MDVVTVVDTDVVAEETAVVDPEVVAVDRSVEDADDVADVVADDDCDVVAEVASVVDADEVADVVPVEAAVELAVDVTVDDALVVAVVNSHSAKPSPEPASPSMASSASFSRPTAALAPGALVLSASTVFVPSRTFTLQTNGDEPRVHELVEWRQYSMKAALIVPTMAEHDASELEEMNRSAAHVASDSSSPEKWVSVHAVTSALSRPICGAHG